MVYQLHPPRFWHAYHNAEPFVGGQLHYNLQIFQFEKRPVVVGRENAFAGGMSETFGLIVFIGNAQYRGTLIVKLVTVKQLD